MSHLSDRLAEIKAEGRSALIGYLPVGFPSVDQSLEAFTALVEAGADIVEVGLPYSDPVLDGIVIQEAAEAALRAGTRVSDVFSAVNAVTEAGAPAVVMSYYNPMLQYGLDRFAAELGEAGGSGVITPDLTPDASPDWMRVSEEHALDRIFLVAPSTTPERMKLTVDASRGFVYAASLMGVTGERSSVGAGAEQLVKAAREAGAGHVCVGLGVSTGEQAAQVAKYADGVIVGSALVKALASGQDFAQGIEALRAKTAELAAGVRGIS